MSKKELLRDVGISESQQEFNEAVAQAYAEYEFAARSSREFFEKLLGGYKEILNSLTEFSNALRKVSDAIKETSIELKITERGQDACNNLNANAVEAPNTTEKTDESNAVTVSQ